MRKNRFAFLEMTTRKSFKQIKSKIKLLATMNSTVSQMKNLQTISFILCAFHRQKRTEQNKNQRKRSLQNTVIRSSSLHFNQHLLFSFIILLFSFFALCLVCAYNVTKQIKTKQNEMNEEKNRNSPISVIPNDFEMFASDAWTMRRK